MEFYNATAYSNQQIKDGESSMKDYTNAVPCVSYHINTETKTQERYMRAFSYVFIELGKLGKEYDQSNITSENEKDWLEFMKDQKLDTKQLKTKRQIITSYTLYVMIHHIESIQTKNNLLEA